MLCNLQHNIRFLQEILQNRKSDFLEWLIIILISVEILISVYNVVQEQMKFSFHYGRDWLVGLNLIGDTRWGLSFWWILRCPIGSLCKEYYSND
jgi:hypothetical protein